MIDGKPEGLYYFQFHKNYVYYVSESLVKRATNISNNSWCTLALVPKKSPRPITFLLTIQCLDLLATHAKRKIWLKPTAEMYFIYGNHVLKGGLGRIIENTAQNEGVVIFSMSDVSLGFGVATNSMQDYRKMEPNMIVAYHRYDIGEYLCIEDEL